MKSLSFREIVEYTKGKIIINNADEVIDKIIIDNREVENNSLFIPIIGEVHDGHKFMELAYDAGCRNFLIDKNHSFSKEDINLIEVCDTTKALGNIARNYRNKFNIPVIGVTGSVGKTSTKDIISAVLKEKYNTLSTIGNLNNEIGIPKTLFNLNDSYEAAVIEMGMSYKGDIKNFSTISNPTIGVISNIGMSHIENFNDQSGIFDAKMEIADNFKKENVLIVNGDDKFLKTLKDRKLNYKLLTYGFNKDNNIYCETFEIIEDKIKFVANFNNKKEEFIIPSIAKHNIYNAMAAILVGLENNIDISLIKQGLAKFVLTKGRLTTIKKESLTIIDDSYNASADSMISALNVLKNYPNRKVAVLGDILETGKYDEKLHRLVGSNIKDNTDVLICVGNSSKYILDEALEDGFDKKNIYHFSNYEELIKEIKNILKENDVVLIKASHGIKLMKVVEYLENEY